MTHKYGFGKLDYKILYELEKNAKIPLQMLAKKTGMSKQLASYKLKKFEEQKIILNYTVLIDSSRLGYCHYRIYLRFRNLSISDRENIFKFFSSISETILVSGIDGYWDSGIIVAVRKVSEFRKVWSKIARFRQNIEDYKISTYSPVHYFTRTLISDLGSGEIPKIMTLGGNDEVKHDLLDVELLKEISKNARKPITEIAKKLKTTPGIIRRRIKNLEHTGIIQGYRPFLNWNKLGYSYYKVDLKLNSYEKNKRIFSFCHLHPNIIQVDETIGGSDFEFEIFAKSKEKFLEIINEMQNKFSDVMESYTYFIISQPHKETFMSF